MLLRARLRGFEGGFQLLGHRTTWALLLPRCRRDATDGRSMAVRPYRLLGDELSLAASTIEGRDQRKGGKVVTIPLAPRTGGRSAWPSASAATGRCSWLLMAAGWTGTARVSTGTPPISLPPTSRVHPGKYWPPSSRLRRAASARRRPVQNREQRAPAHHPGGHYQRAPTADGRGQLAREASPPMGAELGNLLPRCT
jgi:hypothetical protein